MIPANSYFEATYWVTAFPYQGYIQGPWSGGGGVIPSDVHNNLEFDAFEINTDTDPGGDEFELGGLGYAQRQVAGRVGK
jgi:hypothetical protein